MFDCAKSTVAAKETIYYGDAAETHVIEKTIDRTARLRPRPRRLDDQGRARLHLQTRAVRLRTSSQEPPAPN